MSKPKAIKYENLHIGNFLVSIGFYLKELEISLPSASQVLPVSFNLNQQSGKADYTIGDLFGALGGKCFIIEFKKDQKSIITEKHKPQRVALINKLKGEYQSLINISIACHLLCYPSQDGELIKYNLNPYVTSLDKPEHNKYHIEGVDQFINKVTTSNELGVTFENIRKYMALLKLCANSDYEASGVIVSYTSSGGFRYVQYDDLSILEYKLQIEQQIVQEIKKDLDQDLNQGKSQGRGMGGGMSR